MGGGGGGGGLCSYSDKVPRNPCNPWTAIKKTTLSNQNNTFNWWKLISGMPKGTTFLRCTTQEAQTRISRPLKDNMGPLANREN